MLKRLHESINLIVKPSLPTASMWVSREGHVSMGGRGMLELALARGSIGLIEAFHCAKEELNGKP